MDPLKGDRLEDEEDRLEPDKGDRLEEEEDRLEPDKGVVELMLPLGTVNDEPLEAPTPLRPVLEGMPRFGIHGAGTPGESLGLLGGAAGFVGGTAGFGGGAVGLVRTGSEA